MVFNGVGLLLVIAFGAVMYGFGYWGGREDSRANRKGGRGE